MEKEDTNKRRRKKEWTLRERRQKIKERVREPKEKIFTLVVTFFSVVILLYILILGFSGLSGLSSGIILLMASVWFLIIAGLFRKWKKKNILFLASIALLLIVISNFLPVSPLTGTMKVILMAILSIAFVTMIGLMVFLFDLIFYEGGN